MSFAALKFTRGVSYLKGMCMAINEEFYKLIQKIEKDAKKKKAGNAALPAAVEVTETLDVAEQVEVTQAAASEVSVSEPVVTQEKKLAYAREIAQETLKIQSELCQLEEELLPKIEQHNPSDINRELSILESIRERLLALLRSNICPEKQGKVTELIQTYSKTVDENFGEHTQKYSRTIACSFFCNPNNVQGDLQHTYAPSHALLLEQVAKEAAVDYEYNIRLALQALCLAAEDNICRDKPEQISTQVHTERSRTWHVVTRQYVKGPVAVEKIHGDAPAHGGSKTLYSVTTPSGKQCAVGLRTMADSRNYCLYPLARLDANSNTWIAYPTGAVQTICEHSGARAILTGLHITTPIELQSLICSPLSQNRRGTSYVANSSHLSADVYSETINPESTKLGFFRIQTRPRVEVSQLGSEYMLRCGRPIIVPFSLGESDKLPDFLGKLPIVLQRDKHQGFIKDGDSRENDFLMRLMKTNLWLVGQETVAEVAMIGKLLRQMGVTPQSSKEEILTQYAELVNLIENEGDDDLIARQTAFAEESYRQDEEKGFRYPPFSPRLSCLMRTATEEPPALDLDGSGQNNAM